MMATQPTKKPRTKKAPAKTVEPAIIAYKGFDKDLACRGYQYAVGQTFEHKGRVEACSSGFHSCENPWDVLSYYPLGGDNRFAVVKASGTIGRHSSDSKIASATLHIEAELKLPDFITRAIEWTIAATKVAVGAKAAGLLTDNGEDRARIGSSGYGAQIGSSGNGAQIGSSGNGARIGSSGYGAQIGSSGYDAQIGSSGNGARIGSSGNDARIGSSGYGAQIGSSGNDARIGSSGYGAQIGSSGNGAQIGSSGNGARIGSSGYGAQIGSSGYGAQIGSSGNDARIGSSGYDARIGSSGNDARIGSSGYGAQIGSSGNGARIGSSGNDARIDSSGEYAVVASAGPNTTAKGAAGTWISLAEFEWRNGRYECLGFATGCIGQNGLKPDTAYRAEGGKLVQA
jgi:hypothetical protein